MGVNIPYRGRRTAPNLDTESKINGSPYVPVFEPGRIPWKGLVFARFMRSVVIRAAG
jgi:hypothetical protein